MRRRLFVVLLALGFATACYPFSPTVMQCRQEQFPPYCGCPKPGGGFYVEGRDNCAPVG